MRTTVDIDPNLLKRLRDEAKRRGISLTEMLTVVVRRGLDERQRAPRFRLRTYAMGNVREGIDLTKALRIAEDYEQ